ncbi:hypothetical protein [Cryocola sp. 340MFSha3.1]|uniref:hypothetical protein n=1 Tax=Cryocola sp. 340MFSha3.1 TaxID=1169145 RepID=UPI00035CE27A|nr:hypothetical protein [Cryocola sp. 340MFSha3.1]
MRIDEDGDAGEVEAPIGAPLRWYEAVLPAALLALGAVAAVLIVAPRETLGYAVYLLVASVVALAAAVSLGICAWCAYATLEPLWVRRYRVAAEAALAALAFLVLLGPFPIFLWAVVGYRAAAPDLPWVARIAVRASHPPWRRGAVWFGVFAVVLTVARPLAQALGSPLLFVPVLVAGAGLALAAGFAYRLGRSAA